jgi:alkylation response protein AidB-like acyl-CoA dehydrogenase
MVSSVILEGNDPTGSELGQLVERLLREFDPSQTDRIEFLRARFDAGLAWVHYPRGLGGLGIPQGWQERVDACLEAAGAPHNEPRKNGIGLGMAAPTILAFGTDSQKARFMRPLWTGEELWCQLFSEPGAGSDLASVSTRAVRAEDASWQVDGQKVWTSGAHKARWAILLARTDIDKPKHAGLSYFVCDMTADGVDVRPLRQLTGEAEFNEVFLTGVRIPDAQRLGDVGQGWQIAITTLTSERGAIGRSSVREEGMIGVVANLWRESPEVRRPDLHARLVDLWVRTELLRLTRIRFNQASGGGSLGPQGSALKLLFAALSQQTSGLEIEMRGAEGLRYDSWVMTRPVMVEFTGRGPGYRYLRSRGNSIEGGTSEILRNIIAERVLGLSREIWGEKSGTGNMGRKKCGVQGRGTATSEMAAVADSDDETLLRDSVRGFLAKHCPHRRVAALYDDEYGAEGTVWTGLSDLGLTGLLIPEHFGGVGGKPTDAAVVLEELGYAAAPGPFLASSVVAATILTTLEDHGALQRLAEGEIAVVALPVDRTSLDEQLPFGLAGRSVHGSVAMVSGAAQADMFLVPVRSPSGVSLYLVESGAPGVTVDRVPALDMTRALADVSMSEATGKCLAVDCGPVIQRALMLGAALATSDQLGGAQWCLDQLVDFLKTRHQFGRPIGGFQAIKHRMADLWVEVEFMRTAARNAAVAAVSDDDNESALAAALAQSFSSDAAVHVAEETIQLHGGIAFTWEHPAHLYLKRAKASQVVLGTAGANRIILANSLDLPNV